MHRPDVLRRVCQRFVSCTSDGVAQSFCHLITSGAANLMHDCTMVVVDEPACQLLAPVLAGLGTF